MSYWITRWGNILLKTVSQEADATVAARLVPLPTGAYDPKGMGQAPRGVEQLLVQCVAHQYVASLRRALVDELSATIGKRNRLYRQAEDDSSWQWLPARLVEIRHSRRASGATNQVSFDLFFEAIAPWQGDFHGSGWLLDEGEFLDSGLQLNEGDTAFTQADGDNLTLPNAGNAVQRAVRIVFTPATTLSPSPGNHSITIGVGDAYLEFYGAITGGQSLVIDTGTFSVTNNAVDAYDDFELGSLHALEGWLELEPGDNDCAIDVLGTPNYSITFEYRDAWH